jgi:hypothetical protein
MKKMAAATSLLFVSFFCLAQSQAPPAEEVLKQAYTQAAQENKNVLLIFHASWCGWCHKMDTSLNDSNVKPLIDKNYITTHLTVYESNGKKDLENPGALEFLTRHGGADEGIPYWLVLGKNGKVLATSEYEPGRNSGCPANEKEVAYFVSVLRKTSSLSDEELRVIEKRFRQNEQRSAAQLPE